jgi:hypothetical protein
VTDELKDASGIPGWFTTADAELRSEIIDGRGIVTSGAELLDGNGKAVYNDHRFRGGGGEDRILAKRRGLAAASLPPKRAAILLKLPSHPQAR